MNNKSGHIIRPILGAYLTYLGVRILMQVIKTEPSNSEIMGVLSVLFILIGGGYAIFSIRNLIKVYKSENAKNSGIDETQELNIPENAGSIRENVGDIRKTAPVRKADKNEKRSVAMQQVGPAENTSAADTGKAKAGEETDHADSSGSPSDGSEETPGSEGERSGNEPEASYDKEEITADTEETEKQQ